MNDIRLQRASNEVFGIPELRDQIFEDIEFRELLYVSKSFHQSGRKKLETDYQKKEDLRTSLTKYCDRISKTNPRWSYYIYRNNYEDDFKPLDRYVSLAINDFPSKFWLLTSLTTTFVGYFSLGPRAILSTVIVGFYFLIFHIITLVALDKCNYYVDANRIFRGITTILVTLSLLVNIANKI